MPPDNIQIIPVKTGKTLKEFIKFPYRLYQEDPHWNPPLYLERKEVLHPKKNPYYGHATVQLYLAKKDGKTAGRLSAQIDQEYEKFQGERVGHFGFFESIQDPMVASALFQEAETFFKSHRVSKVLGPYNFSSNEESGLLIDGFDQPLMTMMPYNPPYYADLIEASGYSKTKDLYAWKYEVGEIPQGPLEMAESLRDYPGLTIRNINPKNFAADIHTLMDIYNSAWSENWGFVPVTSEEAKKVAKDLKMILDPKIAFIAELDGEPAAMCVSIPNIYELIRGLKGRLFPAGFLKLWWRIRKKKYRSCRLMMFGIKKEFLGGGLGGLSILLYVHMHRYAQQQAYQYGELSWTLEDNHPVNAGIEFMGGRRYKTYRVYQKNL